MILKVLSNLNHSMTLWVYDDMAQSTTRCKLCDNWKGAHTPLALSLLNWNLPIYQKRKNKKFGIMLGYSKYFEPNYHCKIEIFGNLPTKPVASITSRGVKWGRGQCLSRSIQVTVRLNSPCANIVKCCTQKMKTQFGHMNEWEWKLQGCLAK